MVTLIHTEYTKKKRKGKGKKIKTGRNLNPVKKIVEGSLELLGRKSP
jgi:hypothetical protein